MTAFALLALLVAASDAPPTPPQPAPPKPAPTQPAPTPEQKRPLVERVPDENDGLVTPKAKTDRPLVERVPEGAPKATGPKGKEELFDEIVAWVNDDVILWSELREQEQMAISHLMEENKDAAPDELAKHVADIKQNALMQLISNRLLVQEAERLYNLEEMKKDLLKRFKERQKIKTDEELDRQLVQWGLAKSELEDRLVQGAAPDYVVDTQVTKNLGVAEAEARDYYEKNKEKLSSPAQITFREIVLVTPDEDARAKRRAAADEVVAKARGGADFAALVKQYSEVPSKAIGGRIGPVRPADIVPEIAKAALAVPVGGVSDPIATKNGWHVIRVDERVDAKTPTFEQARADVEAAVRQQKLGPALEKYMKGVVATATIEVRRSYMDRVNPEFKDKVVPHD